MLVDFLSPLSPPLWAGKPPGGGGDAGGNFIFPGRQRKRMNSFIYFEFSATFYPFNIYRKPPFLGNYFQFNYLKMGVVFKSS